MKTHYLKGLFTKVCARLYVSCIFVVVRKETDSLRRNKNLASPDLIWESCYESCSQGISLYRTYTEKMKTTGARDLIVPVDVCNT